MQILAETYRVDPIAYVHDGLSTFQIDQIKTRKSELKSKVAQIIE